MLIQWVIKQSSIEKKKKGTNQPGLDLTRAVGDVLLTLGLVSRDADCCNYSLNGQYNIYTPLTGTTVTIKSNSIQDNLIAPSSNLAALQIDLPVDPFEGQTVQLTFSRPVTTLTITGNGNNILGTNPTAAVIGNRFTFKFYKDLKWIRIN